jgi:hypothetical protein
MTAKEYLDLRAGERRLVMYAGDWSIPADELAAEIERLRAANAAPVVACECLRVMKIREGPIVAIHRVQDRILAEHGWDGCEQQGDFVERIADATIAKARAARKGGVRWQTTTNGPISWTRCRGTSCPSSTPRCGRGLRPPPATGEDWGDRYARLTEVNGVIAAARDLWARVRYPRRDPT